MTKRELKAKYRTYTALEAAFRVVYDVLHELDEALAHGYRMREDLELDLKQAGETLAQVRGGLVDDPAGYELYELLQIAFNRAHEVLRALHIALITGQYVRADLADDVQAQHTALETARPKLIEKMNGYAELLNGKGRK